MKDYEVTLMAVSYKTVTVTAPSGRDAVKMAQKIYFSTDALNFTDEDVKKISADVCEADPSPEDENADDAAEEDSEISDDDAEEEPGKKNEENGDAGSSSEACADHTRLETSG